jgi:HEAT repeat protein
LVLAFFTLRIGAASPSWQGPTAQQASQHPLSQEPAPAKPSTVVSSEGELQLAYKFPPGESAVYRLEYDSTANADFRVLFEDKKNRNGEPGQSQATMLVYSLKAGLRGELAVTVLQNEPHRIAAVYQLRDLSTVVVVNGQEQTAQVESVQRDLGHGFLVELTPEGRVISLRMDPSVDKFSKDFALTLLSATEFILPSTASANTHTWEIREEDRTGPYLARYLIAGDCSQKTRGESSHPGCALIRKRKIRYFPEITKQSAGSLPGQKAAKKTVTPSGSLEAQFDLTQGRVISLEGVEAQNTDIEGKNVAHSETTLRMKGVAMKRLAPDEMAGIRQLGASLEASGLRFLLYTKPAAEEMQANIQRAELGTATLEGLVPQLGMLEISREKSDETALYLKFKALIYLHPESCDPLGKILSTADPKGPTFRILAGALGAIGSQPAQQALIAAIRARPQDWHALSNLIPTLSSVPSPGIDAEKELQALTTSADPNISSTALLSLGTVAHNLADKEPERSASIVNELVRQADVSQTEEEAHHVLEALGNTASVQALPALSKFASGSSPRLRAAALDALRLIHSRQADALLIHGLTVDADATVRLEAAYALGFRKMTPSSFTSQKQVLLGESDDKVRAALLSNLWKVHQKFPDARQLVEEAAEKDPSEYVRKVAKGLLLESP